MQTNANVAKVPNEMVNGENVQASVFSNEWFALAASGAAVRIKPISENLSSFLYDVVLFPFFSRALSPRKLQFLDLCSLELSELA